MGLKASATCVINFGENDGCRGIILGNPPGPDGAGEGIAQMFQMMNGARFRTGLSSLAVAASAYAYSVEYAKQRIQGRLYTNPKSGRVPIIKHEDIRRMLLSQKAHIEGQRALLAKTALMIDVADWAESLEERTKAKAWVDVCTPMIKAYCSDMAWQTIADAIQVHGGYGFIEDYGVAQCARDVKIFSLYEGTNFIQSLDLIGRKFNMSKGQTFESWLNGLKEDIDKCAAGAGFEAEAAMMTEAWETVKKIRDWYAVQAGEGGNKALQPLYSTRTLHCCAQLVCGQLLLDQGVLAAGKAAQLGEQHYDYAFYKGKEYAARFFVHNVIPIITATYKIIIDADTSAIEIPEESF